MHPAIIKLLDRCLGTLLVFLLEQKNRIHIETVNSILIIRPGGIGDAVLLVPAIRALKEHYPDACITVLAEKRNGAIFSLCHAVDRVLLYDRPGELLAAIRGRYDVAIDTEQWYRLSAVVTRLAHAPVRIGFATNERKRLFTHTVPYDPVQYEAEAFFRLLEPLGIPVPSRIDIPFIELPRTADQDAERLLAPLSGRSFVAVFPGASVPEKQWGEDKFRELIAHLGGRGLAVVLLGGADTRPVGARLAVAPLVHDLTGRCSLAVSAAILARGRMLVSGDSGLLHIAAGFGVPTVSLFGPSDPVKWAPRGRSHQYLCADPSCAPCSRFGTITPCERSACCLAEITAAQVIAGVDSLLTKGEGAAPGFMLLREELSGEGNR